MQPESWDNVSRYFADEQQKVSDELQRLYAARQAAPDPQAGIPLQQLPTEDEARLREHQTYLTCLAMRVRAGWQAEQSSIEAQASEELIGELLSLLLCGTASLCEIQVFFEIEAFYPLPSLCRQQGGPQHGRSCRRAAAMDRGAACALQIWVWPPSPHSPGCSFYPRGVHLNACLVSGILGRALSCCISNQGCI